MIDGLHILLLDDWQLLTIHHALTCMEDIQARYYMELPANERRKHLQALTHLGSLINSIEASNDLDIIKPLYIKI